MGSIIFVNGAAILATSRLTPRVDSCVNHSELHAFVECAHGLSDTDSLRSDGVNIAFRDSARSLVWFRGLLAALENLPPDDIPPTPVFVDNAGVVSIINNRTLKSPNRHIFRTIAEIREHVHQIKAVIPIKITSPNNLSDTMTKPAKPHSPSAANLLLIAAPELLS